MAPLKFKTSLYRSVIFALQFSKLSPLLSVASSISTIQHNIMHVSQYEAAKHTY